MFFFTGLAFLSTFLFLSVNLLSCISMKNQECKVRPQIFNLNRDEPVFFPFSVKTSKSRTNETRHIEWHEMCRCKFRLDSSVCNNKHCNVAIMINTGVNTKN